MQAKNKKHITNNIKNIHHIQTNHEQFNSVVMLQKHNVEIH